MFIIGVLVALGVLVIVHEFGHYSAARYFGVTVEKFSVGFGPKLIGIKKGATNFLISLIPLGGYVKMKGDEPTKDREYNPDEFYGQIWWKRILIVFAGPFANLILALILFTLSFLVGRVIEDQPPVIGKVSTEMQSYFQPEDRIISINNNPVNSWTDLIHYTSSEEDYEVIIKREGEILTLHLPELKPELWYTEIFPHVTAVVGGVAPGLPAYRSGMKEGDVIIAVAGDEVDDWYDMRTAIIEYPGDEVELSVLRDEAVITISVPLETNLLDESGRRIIGITQKMEKQFFERYGLLDSARYAFYSTASFVILNYQALFKIISRPFSAKDHIGGPVMIITMSRQTTTRGWGAIIAFVASISLILMIMNLLPIPVLDGGHIFFFLIEGIFKKPLSTKTQSIIQQIGLMFILALMVLAFYNDLSRIVRRNISMRHHEQNEQMIE